MDGGRGIAERMATARAWISRRALAGAALWILLGLEAVLVLAWVLAGPDGWGAGSSAPLLLDLALVAAAVGLLVGVGRWSRRELDEIPFARHVERGAGLEAGAVRGPLELSRSTPPGVSAPLARLGESRLLGSLPEDLAALALGPAEVVGRWLRRGSRVGIVFAVALALLLLFAPGRAVRAWRGLATPVALAAQPVLPPLGVEPGDVSVLRGEDLRIRVSAPGRDSVFLTWEEAGAVPVASTLLVGGGLAEHRYADVRSGFTYRVEGPDGAVAGPFTVDVLDPLILTALTIQLEFPPHTGLGSAEVVGDPPPLEIPRGTSITVTGRASRPLSSVALVGEEPDAARREMEVDGFGFRGSWTPMAGGELAWVLLDEQGRPPDDLLPGLSVRIVEDLSPSLRFVLPTSDTVLPVSRRQPLLLEALDDYGIDRLEVETWRVGSLGREGERARSAIPGGGARDLLFRPVLDVTDWLLAPGDTVKIRATAVDNRPGGGRSPVVELALWLPDEDALRRGAGEEMDEGALRLQEMLERAEELGAVARDLERQAEANGREEGAADPRQRAREDALGFDEREELRRSLDSERELMEAVDSLGAEMGALAEDLSEAGLPDAELQRQLKELEALMAEIADSGTRERLDSLAAALGEMESGDAQRALEDLGDRQAELREQLERALERFQRAAAQQEFRSATREAEDLAREEELMARAMEEGSESEGLADAQEELSERAEGLEERLGELAEQLTRMGEEPSAEQVAAAREEARMAAEEMTASSERMEAGDRQQAASRASQASRRMSEAAQKLQRSQQEMAQRQMREIQESMTRLTADALALARRQGGLQDRMRSATQAELAELRGEQASLLEGLRNMAEQTAAATREAPALGQQLSEAIGQAMQSVQRTVEALERGGRRPGPSPHAASEGAVGSLNRIALQAMAGSQSLNGAGAGDPSQQLLEQLQQIAEQQGDLTNQSESVLPMELSQAAREAEARQIAEGQEAVAGELGDLASDPGSADDALGDLQALAEAAEALARELASGRLDATTVERQEELFHRLLDAGRSLEKDEFADERRSRAPGEVERGAVEALGREDLGGAVIPFPDRTELEGLTPAQRELILQYFERLNRTRGGTAKPAGARPGGGS